MPNEFLSIKHKEAYSDYHSKFATGSNVVHVSGNGKELTVYTDCGNDSVCVSVYGFGYGYENEFIDFTMREQSNVTVNPVLAPLLFKALHSDYFDIANHGEPIAPYVNNKSEIDRAFSAYSAQETEEAIGREVNAGIMVTSYYEEVNQALTVMVRGFEPDFVFSNGTGVAALGGFYADAERATMVRESLVSYYRSEIIGL